jgi:uncharacterized caspase-like protein
MRLLLNEQATTANIRQALTGFITQASEDDLLLIFIASHGAPDTTASQNLYFITYDTDVLNMSQTALRMADLGRYVNDNVKSKRLVCFFDACHSAGISTEGTRA